MGNCVLDSATDDEFFADFARRAVQQRVPLDASIELTHRCNLRCVHCFLGDQDEIRRHRKDELDTDAFKTLLDEMAEAGTLNLTFTGGDPMVRKDFCTLYEYAVHKGFLITVFCDGALITPAVREVFTRLRPRKVEISVYGATRETYERVTQVPGSFERCMEGLDWLAQTGISFTLKTVLMQANSHELDPMRALAAHHGVPFYFDSAIFPCLPHGDNAARANRTMARGALSDIPVQVQSGSSATANTLHAPTEQRLDPQQAADAQLSDPQKVEELVDLYLRTRHSSGDERLYRCSAGQSTVHVDPYGNLQPCTISTNGGYNIADGGFARGWHGPIAAVRELKARPGSSCQSCDKQALCAGCPAFFAAETGDGRDKSNYVCETTHRIFDGIKPAIDARLAAHPLQP
ncbi:MAG: radical SAM protein with 4Fe4S-binding SPASM domain [Gammaproteobacteria bacterium]|jgi:radical SAM protein with 4Fe4S-binding SPASM domain